MGLRPFVTAVLVVAAVLAGPSVGTADVPYEVSLVGVEDEELRERLTEASRLIELKERIPPSLLALRQRAEGDGERLATALASAGYHAGVVEITIETDKTPNVVVLDVQPGPLFRLAEYDVIFVEPGAMPGYLPVPADLGLQVGQPAIAAPIIDAERNVLLELAKRGYPLSKVVDRRVVADHATDEVRVTLLVNAGPLARYGDVTIVGGESVDRDFVIKTLRWEKGERFDSAEVADARRRLVNSRVFRAVRITHAEAVGPDGLLPMTVTLAEDRMRSVGGGLNFSTSEGPGGKAFWEHRNLFGGGEQFRIEAEGSFTRMGAEAEYRKPYFLDPRQDLILTVEAREETPRGYEAFIIGGRGAIERRLDEQHNVRFGPGAEWLRVIDDGDKRKFMLLSFPTSLTRDTSDDLLNPTEGHRAELSVTPYRDLFSGNMWLQNRISGSIYQKLDGEGRFVLAGRGTFETIQGAGLGDVPKPRRLFAGGGGSIRGYDYQEAGTLDSENDPIGGLSVVEIGAEMRIRIGESWGVVPFVEGGRYFLDSVPDFSERLLWAVGLGVRYYTDFGPIRVDVATPINRRSTDSIAQFYISIGQAF